VQTRKLGALEVSVVGLGCNNFGRRIDADATQAVVDAALDAGVTFFDTADVYNGDLGWSEELLARALGPRRDQVVIATKFGAPLDDDRRGAHPDYVRSACDDSLRRLGSDHIDLYQLHVPDPQVPIVETLGALGELVEAGKVREIGHSNFSGAQIDEAEAAATAGTPRFVSAQNQWSLLDRDVEADVLPAARRHGLAVLPYFPLSSGLLTGKYRQGQDPDPSWRLARIPAERRDRFLNDARLATVEQLRLFAEERGRTLLELAMSWLAGQDIVASVIAGATTPAQVRANAAAASWQLGPEELAELDRITAQGDTAAGSPS
jgi:aryl-alcohol dehydrogenase-like predicted oxidoreductase